MSKVKKSYAPTQAPRKKPGAPSKAKRSQRRRIYLWAGAGAVLVLLIGLAIYANVRRTIPVEGQETFATQGNAHIGADAPNAFVYNSTPPTSGPHYPNTAQWGISSQPQPYEYLLHNLEDGGVVIYYQCPEGCADTVAALTEVVQPLLAANRRLILTPNDPTWVDAGGQPLHRDMGAPIAVTAWGRLLKLDNVDVPRIQAFISKYEGINNHAPGAG